MYQTAFTPIVLKTGSGAERVVKQALFNSLTPSEIYADWNGEVRWGKPLDRFYDMQEFRLFYRQVSGRPDLVIRMEDEIIVVEVKSATAKGFLSLTKTPKKAHRLQASAYCYMMTELGVVKPTKYCIIYISRENMGKYVDDYIKEYILDYTPEIHQMQCQRFDDLEQRLANAKANS
jgi:Holliday junction resolvase-like predicted endonuclease